MRDVDDVRLVESLAQRAAHEDECGVLHGASKGVSRGGPGGTGDALSSGGPRSLLTHGTTKTQRSGIPLERDAAE
jgi:hypothetical protein